MIVIVYRLVDTISPIWIRLELTASIWIIQRQESLIWTFIILVETSFLRSLYKCCVSGEKDLDRKFMLPPTTYIGGDQTVLSLREILNRLKVIGVLIFCSQSRIQLVTELLSPCSLLTTTELC
jgi:hypothetical protein